MTDLELQLLKNQNSIIRMLILLLPLIPNSEMRGTKSHKYKENMNHEYKENMNHELSAREQESQNLLIGRPADWRP